jgi:hypothetical protein
LAKNCAYSINRHSAGQAKSPFKKVVAALFQQSHELVCANIAPLIDEADFCADQCAVFKQ